MSVKVTSKSTVTGENLQKFLESVDKHNNVAKIGWFRGALYDSESKKSKSPIPVAYIATIQEFGLPEKNIPSRSFMRTTMSEKHDTWKNFTGKFIKNAISKGLSVDQVLDMRGQLMEGDIRKKITQINSPPLKPSTIKARLRGKSDKKTQGLLDKPLIDSKIMLNTLTSRVEKK